MKLLQTNKEEEWMWKFTLPLLLRAKPVVILKKLPPSSKRGSHLKLTTGPTSEKMSFNCSSVAS